MKSLRIGKLKLVNPLILAPMVDVTDLPYRLLCQKAGAALTFTEMIYVDAILHTNPKTENLMKIDKSERPVGLQITGNDVGEVEKFVQLKRTWRDFDVIDLNCGCPSIRITGSRAGSYLLNDPEKIGKMIRILKKTGKPVSAKIRLGFKKNNVLAVARVVEKAGADALTVHTRLAIHGKSVPADWQWFEKVRKEISIPLIGNGDVFFGENARRMLEVCDGVMIARGAIGDPWIFERVLHYLKTGKGKEFSLQKNLIAFREYLKLQKKFYGASVDLGRVKYVGGKFFRGFEGAAARREELSKATSLKEMERLVGEVRKMNIL